MRRYVPLTRITQAAHKHFLLTNFIQKSLRSLGKEVVSNLAGISFRMYKIIPPHLPFLSDLIGAAHPSIMNWLDENIESNFVSEIINLSKLPLMLFKRFSDLFRIEFMFMWPTVHMLILAMRVGCNLLRKDVLSLLSLFSSIKLIWSVDDCPR